MMKEKRKEEQRAESRRLGTWSQKAVYKDQSEPSKQWQCINHSPCHPLVHLCAGNVETNGAVC